MVITVGNLLESDELRGRLRGLRYRYSSHHNFVRYKLNEPDR